MKLNPVTTMSLEQINEMNALYWADRSLDDQASVMIPDITEEALRIMAAEATVGLPMQRRLSLSAALDAARENRRNPGLHKRRCSSPFRLGGVATQPVSAPPDPISIMIQDRLREIAAKSTDEFDIITQATRILPFVYYRSKPAASPANFRSCSHSTCMKELARLRSVARKTKALISGNMGNKSFCRAGSNLRDAIAELRQPTILVLANCGMIGERHRLRDRTIGPGVPEHDLETTIGAASQALEWLSTARRSDESYTALGLRSSRGRPASAEARAVARVLHDAYVKLSGRRATLTVRPERVGTPVDGPFFQLVKDIFVLAGIRANPEAVARQTINDMA
jgi:hypothetical protein